MTLENFLNRNAKFDNRDLEGVNVSELLVWFSELNRYGTDFKKINVTLFDLEPYAQSVAIYVAIAGIVAIGLTIILIVFCCCNCLFRNAAPRKFKSKKGHKNKDNSCFCISFLIVFAISGALTFIVGFIGEARIHKGGDSFCDTVDELDDKAKFILNETRKLILFSG